MTLRNKSAGDSFRTTPRQLRRVSPSLVLLISFFFFEGFSRDLHFAPNNNNPDVFQQQLVSSLAADRPCFPTLEVNRKRTGLPPASGRGAGGQRGKRTHMNGR